MESDSVFTSDLCTVNDYNRCADHCESEYSLRSVDYVEIFLSRHPQKMKKTSDSDPWNVSNLLVNQVDLFLATGAVRHPDNQSCNMWTSTTSVYSIRSFNATCVNHKTIISILIVVFVDLKYRCQRRGMCPYAPMLPSSPGTLWALSQLNMTPTSQTTMFI